jgi:hypothetical protein
MTSFPHLHTNERVLFRTRQSLFVKFIFWQRVTLTVTSERILIERRILFWTTTQTIRWDAYQESIFVGGLFARITNAGTLTIRYGTMDAARSATITAVPFARDLKHYLDKIHSLKASKAAAANLPQFVRARRGKRDRAVLSY